MNGLNEQYSDRVDFIHIDIEQPGSRDLMEQFDVRRRSTYVLLGPDGVELFRWQGPLSQESVAATLDTLLEQ